jgi:hypothetical protein
MQIDKITHSIKLLQKQRDEVSRLQNFLHNGNVSPREKLNACEQFLESLYSVREDTYEPTIANLEYFRAMRRERDSLTSREKTRHGLPYFD